MKKKLPKHEITGELRPRLSLYEMVGLNVNPYRVNTFDEYKASLEKMNFSELHDHAAQEAGVVPIDDREKLIERLLRQYAIVNGQLEANAIQRDESLKQKQQKTTHLTGAQQKQVKDLLSRGR